MGDIPTAAKLTSCAGEAGDITADLLSSYILKVERVVTQGVLSWTHVRECLPRLEELTWTAGSSDWGVTDASWNPETLSQGRVERCGALGHADAQLFEE